MQLKFTFFIFFSFFTSKSYNQAPNITWNMSFGGSELELGYEIIALPEGSFLSVGATGSSDGDIDTNAGNVDIFVVKVNADNDLVLSKTFGGSESDYGLCAVEAYHSGYIIGGYSASNDGVFSVNYGGSDGVLLKIDSMGNLEWVRNYGGSNYDEIHSVIQTNDSAYIFTGRSYSTDFDITDPLGASDIIVGKVDMLGNLLWIKSYGSAGYDGAHQIIKTRDSCYLICGFRDFFAPGDYFIFKINASGDLLWEKTYGGSESDVAYSIYELSNGKIVVSGYTTSNDGDVSFAHGGSDNWVLYLDSAGDLLWERAYGGTGFETGHRIYETHDLSILVAGSATTYNNGDVTGSVGSGDYWVLKIDTLGIIQWSDCYGGTDGDSGKGSAQLTDSSYVIVGASTSNDGDVVDHHEGVGDNSDMWIIKLKEDCIQQKYYADVDNDGYGNMFSYIYSCVDTVGYVFDNTDCNDTIASINPGAKDICNSIDDNCNGEIDENSVFTLWYQDEDNDGFGNPEMDTLACMPIEGYVADSTDCDDTNPDIYPGAPEILNGLDDDCDLLIDENLTLIEMFLQSFKIYPNPTEDILNIEFTGTEIINIEILNTTGQILLTDKITASSTEINVSEFSSGMYVLRLYVDENVTAITFVKE